MRLTVPEFFARKLAILAAPDSSLRKGMSWDQTTFRVTTVLITNGEG